MSQKITIKSLEVEEFKKYYNEHRGVVFADDHSCSIRDLLSDDESNNIEELGKNMGSPFKLFLAAFDENNEFVGWSWGFQENSETYYMCNSAVLEGHRKKGIYTMMLNKSIEILTEKGFQVIYSRHNATNNSVIIPKLKAGFLISKFEISDVFGVLVHLHYYTNKTREKIMDYRAGQLSPDKEIKEIFKL